MSFRVRGFLLLSFLSQENCSKGDLKKHLESFKQGTGELITLSDFYGPFEIQYPDLRSYVSKVFIWYIYVIKYHQHSKLYSGQVPGRAVLQASTPLAGSNSAARAGRARGMRTGMTWEQRSGSSSIPQNPSPERASTIPDTNSSDTSWSILAWMPLVHSSHVTSLGK